MKPKAWLIAALLIASITFAALSYKIWQLRRELVSMEWEYEILAQEIARFKDELTEVSRDTLTADEIKDFLKGRGIKTEQ